MLTNTNKNLFEGPRICKYCGISIDVEDLELLKFFHETCWQQYRANNEIYEMPANV